MPFPRPSPLRSMLRSLFSGNGLRSVAVPPATGYPENASLDAWLARAAPESTLEPELRICDAHHHLWDHRGVAWGSIWKQSVYLLPELLRDVTDGHNVVSTVYVQVLQQRVVRERTPGPSCPQTALVRGHTGLVIHQLACRPSRSTAASAPRRSGRWAKWSSRKVL